jgi:hypothetical protein
LLNLIFFPTIIVDYKSVTDENLGFTSRLNRFSWYPFWCMRVQIFAHHFKPGGF